MPPKPQGPEPIDLNILPPAYRPRTASPIITLLYSISAVLLLVLIITVVLTATNRSRANELTTQLEQVQAQLKTIRTPAPQVIALTNELTRTQASVMALEAVEPDVTALQRDWRAVFEALLNRNPNQIKLEQLVQDRSELTLSGLARTQDDVLSYASDLDQSGVFEQVIIQSMDSVSAAFDTPTAAPVVTGTLGTPSVPVPGQPTATPTTSPYDAYEIDDFEPRAIALGEIQWHNFNPIYDQDQMVFLGKAGRRYCIQALPQVLGVDTYLEIVVDGISYVNDDCMPSESQLLSCQCPSGTVTATLASLVEVQLPPDADRMVHIKVTNRGQYGGNKWYTVLVSEATGDPWEKDDLTPKPIAVGEAQMRTFHPDGDIDRVTFPIKAGHAYEVRTRNLALGVDTVLAVLANGITYTNDDVAPGDASSRVNFEAAADGTASITVSNKGIFGPNMTYTLQLLEIGGDAYESDDYTPRPLSPWEHQRHTFFPQGDIDRVEFNVKANHIYEIKTYSLTVGVDTVLSVLVQGTLYENDDVSPGDASSYVTFKAPTDGTAGVTITNREQFGSNKEYWLTLSELVGTLTPTPGSGGVVATPTPDCGDEYEPDDLVGRLMVVGAVQPHNFCPDGDVDRVVFTAKNGYAYQIETEDLALGVDTYLQVKLGSTTLTNDDRSPQDLSSVVQMQNLTGTDSPAFVTVMNKGVFGESMTYALKITDVDQGDAYEVDDVNPASIGLGSAQQRTFYPPGDVDKVIFIAKTNHRYSIYTTIPPDTHIDTLINVDMGSTHLSNDDRLPGDLSSYLELQNFSTTDTQAVVTVLNNGQYHPDEIYTIQVDDLGSVSGDIYEPDLEIKRYISVGEYQLHTFHPDQDVDRVTLMVKAGRRYSISTCGGEAPEAVAAGTPTPIPVCEPLVPGVDTVLIVSGPIYNCNPASCQNDDHNPGSGSLASTVEFEALVDGEVTITVYNKGLFGPTMEYNISVIEIGALPPTPILVTPTPYYSPTPTLTWTPAPPPTWTPTPTAVVALVGTPVPAGPGGRSWAGLAALKLPLHLRSAAPQQATGQIVEFVLLLRMKAITP